MDRSLRFTERVAEDLMTPRTRVLTLAADDTLADLVAHARRTGISRFPVCADDPDTVLGVVHVKQAFAVPAPARATTALRECVQPVPTVPQSLDGDALMTTLRGSGLQLAVVVDEYGGIAGHRHPRGRRSRRSSATSATSTTASEQAAGAAAPAGTPGSCPGCCATDEVATPPASRCPPGDYETLAGLVLARLGRIPDVGDDVGVDGWHLTVVRRDRNRVAELRRTARLPGAGSVTAAYDCSPCSTAVLLLAATRSSSAPSSR